MSTGAPGGIGLIHALARVAAGAHDRRSPCCCRRSPSPSSASYISSSACAPTCSTRVASRSSPRRDAPPSRPSRCSPDADATERLTTSRRPSTRAIAVIAASSTTATLHRACCAPPARTVPLVCRGPREQGLPRGDLREPRAAHGRRQRRPRETVSWQSVAVANVDGHRVRSGAHRPARCSTPSAGGRYQLYLVYDLARRAADARLRAAHAAARRARARPADRRRRLPHRAARRRAGAGRGRDAARSSPPATSRSACPSAATTSSPRSRARSTGWPTACSARSGSSPTCRACSSASSPTSRTSCARRSPPSGSRATCSTTSATTSRPTTARTAELLHTQIERFESLLADLLEMSRYDAGAVQLETDPTNLVRLVEERSRRSRRSPTRRAARSGWSRPAGTSRPMSTRAASAASCRTCSATRSTTARRKPIVVYVDSDARRRRDRRARLRGRDVAAADIGARVRPVLARRPVAPAHHRRHRTRPRDLARGRGRARRRARRLVGARRGQLLPPHPAAPAAATIWAAESPLALPPDAEAGA